MRDLAQNGAALNFLLPHPQKPIFGNNCVEVTRKVADIIAEVFRKIIARGEDRTRAQRFILQLLVSVVAEDLGLLPGEIGPTIVRLWRERIDAAGKHIGKLREVLAALRRFRVLDPACGSGNFLFVAYREIKRLEREILLALRDAGERPERLATGILLTNFFGLDVVPFAVELAKVTLMLAKELELREADKFAAADGLHLPERPLPLDMRLPALSMFGNS